MPQPFGREAPGYALKSQTRPRVKKILNGFNARMFVKKLVFVPGRPFQPSLMFVNKANPTLPTLEWNIRMML
jgi:hypothetical protein